MIEALTKTRHPLLDEFYVGQNGSRRVECILDNYCLDLVSKLLTLED